jgi:glutaredoxin
VVVEQVEPAEAVEQVRRQTMAAAAEVQVPQVEPADQHHVMLWEIQELQELRLEMVELEDKAEFSSSTTQILE